MNVTLTPELALALAQIFIQIKREFQSKQPDPAKPVTDEQVLELLKATKLNSQVRQANGVPEIISRIASDRKVKLPTHNPADFDDDIPF